MLLTKQNETESLHIKNEETLAESISNKYAIKKCLI